MIIIEHPLKFHDAFVVNTITSAFFCEINLTVGTSVSLHLTRSKFFNYYLRDVDH